MNADPEQGQPSTAPEASDPETTGAETTRDEVTASDTAEMAVSEAEARDAEAAEAEAGAEAEAESAAGEPAAEETEVEPEPEVEPETPQPTPTTPLVAGRYRLVAEIGGGAMGVVWRARDEVLGRDVAVKELRPDHGMSGAQVRVSHQRARREGRIAARLQHPNAVVIYDVAEHEGRPYLIMEYVPSQNLGDILATGAVLTPAEVTKIGAQLASALTAAHERGIVHRDIKPGNVLMTADGTVKLTDFGISRATGDATVTATGEILGTPAYTAPEVAQGHPVAFPADVFSLGATLYAAVEGTPPFGEDVNAMALLLRVVRNEIRLPRRSGPLTDTIMRMLSPEPADRPTMKEAWQALDTLATKPLPAVAPRSKAPETRPFGIPAPTVVVMDSPVVKGGTTSPDADAWSGTEPWSGIEAETSQSSKSADSPAAKPKPAPGLDRTPTTAIDSTQTPLIPPTTRTAATPAAGATTSAAKPPTATTPSAAKPATATTPSATTPAAAAAAAAPIIAAPSAAAPPPPAAKRPLTAASAERPESGSRSRMPLAVTVLVAGTAILVVAIVIVMNAGKHSANQPVAHSSTAASQPPKSQPTGASHVPSTPSHTSAASSSAASSSPSATSATPTTPTTSPTSATSPTTSPTTSATDVNGQMVAFLTGYYSLLPNNLAQAWPDLTPAYQVSPAGGYDGYTSWWSQVSRVSLSDVSATGPSTVVATIHYQMKDGSRTDERTTFGLVKDGDSWKINTSHVD